MQITLRDDIAERVVARAKEEDRSPTQVVNRFLETMPSLAGEKLGIKCIGSVVPVKHPAGVKVRRRP